MTRQELNRKILAFTHFPHQLCKNIAGQLFEFISYPWIEDDKILVYIRVPGDPTTLKRVDAYSVDPEGRECMCHAAKAVTGSSEFYMRVDYR